MAMAARSLVQNFRVRELRRVLPPIASSSSPRQKVAIENPFIPHLNPETGCWAPPRYSRRRQAELIKQARIEGTLHLLPPGPKMLNPPNPPKPPKISLSQDEKKKAKKTADKQKAKAKLEPTKPVSFDDVLPVEWVGQVRIRQPAGSDIGNKLYAGKKQMFKGHKWERLHRKNTYYRAILMRDMRKRLKRWRNGRARASNPFKIPPFKEGKKFVLPF